jgi:hypothetical protein
MLNLTRRQALYMGLIPVAISVMPRIVAAVLGLGDNGATDRATAPRCYRDLFTDLDPPAAIGRRYLQDCPQEGDCAFLHKAITGETQPRDARELRTLLAQKRERDFRNGDTAIVDGWVLARTEVRVCALIALL